MSNLDRDRARELAALHAAGALEGDDRDAFHAALEREDELLLEEMRGFGAVVEDLVESIPPVEPDPALRDRILERTEAPLVVRKEESGWQATPIDGVEIRTLFTDPANDRMTALVRMRAGTSYPAHVHSGAEECYVLEGDLSFGETRLDAGDYQRAEEGTLHGLQSTEDGCLLLIVASMSDELLT